MKEVAGDLIQLAYDGKFDVIVHGCNCECMMGGGIAKQIVEEIFGNSTFVQEGSPILLSPYFYLSPNFYDCLVERFW